MSTTTGSQSALRRSEWVVRLQEFTERNSSRSTVLEEDGLDVGAQREEVDLPLRGVAWDPRDERVEIMLGGLYGTERHLTRTISEVTAIHLLTGTSGRDEALRIAHEGGQTLLSFQR
jgi:hypothetical protein